MTPPEDLAMVFDKAGTLSRRPVEVVAHLNITQHAAVLLNVTLYSLQTGAYKLQSTHSGELC